MADASRHALARAEPGRVGRPLRLRPSLAFDTGLLFFVALVLLWDDPTSVGVGFGSGKGLPVRHPDTEPHVQLYAPHVTHRLIAGTMSA